MTTTLKTALIQQNKSTDLDKNFADSLNAIRQAADAGAKLIVLQELHRSLYFCQQEDVDAFDLAETIPGPTTDALGELAKLLDVVIVADLLGLNSSRWQQEESLVRRHLLENDLRYGSLARLGHTH